jgi:hypothetical protein
LVNVGAQSAGATTVGTVTVQFFQLESVPEVDTALIEKE